MNITLNIWSSSKVGTRIYFNDAHGNAIGFFARKLAGAYSRDANSFTSTVPADIFTQIVDFVYPSYFGQDVEHDDEHTYQALVAHCTNHAPIGMSAKATKAARAEQKARVAAFAKEFA